MRRVIERARCLTFNKTGPRERCAAALRGCSFSTRHHSTAGAVGYIPPPPPGLLADVYFGHREDHTFLLEQVEPLERGADGTDANWVELLQVWQCQRRHAARAAADREVAGVVLGRLAGETFEHRLEDVLGLGDDANRITFRELRFLR